MQSYPYDVLDVASRNSGDAPEQPRKKGRGRRAIIAAIAALAVLGAGVAALAANVPLIAYDQPAIAANAHLPIVPAAPGVHGGNVSTSRSVGESGGPERIGSTNPFVSSSAAAADVHASNAWTQPRRSS